MNKQINSLRDSNNKTIHVVNKYFYPITAGIETNIIEVYSILAKKGWDVTVHTSKSTLTENNVLPNDEEINGLKIKRYTYHWYGFFPKLDWQKANVVSLHNFNIFPHSLIFLYCLFLKLTGKKKFIFILSPHSGFNPDWKTFPKSQAIVKFIYHYTIGTFFINNVTDGVRAISQWELKEIIKKGVTPSLIKLIKNGLPEDAFKNVDNLVSKKFKTKVEKIEPYIVQVGRVHQIKNYEVTIKALAKLPQNLNYLIVGPEQDRGYKNKLEKLIKELDLGNQVIFLGEVGSVDKYYLLKHAELMIHMATHEGFCNTVHEGMSQGLVCIVSNRTALPFLIKDGVNGFCLDSDDFKAVAQKIKFVLENKNSQAIKEIEKRNIRCTKNHSWENIAREVEAFYRDTLKVQKEKYEIF